MKKVPVKQSALLTLYDRLSHLTYKQACDILGKENTFMLRQPLPLDDFNIEKDLYLDDDLFRLSIREFDSTKTVVSITIASWAKNRLHFNCSTCSSPEQTKTDPCVHIATALSFILEEKSLIGLAEHPDLDTPIELLSEKQLFQRALHERQERANTEAFSVKSQDRSTPWTDYILSSEASGKTYRIALRGEEHGTSYCSCPDFKTNRLGTCKHILYLLKNGRKKFSDAIWNAPYKNEEAFVSVQYGEERTLQLTLPDKTDECDCEICHESLKIAKPFLKKSIADVQSLLKTVSKLEAIGRAVTIYPDAEELIQQQLFKDKVKSLVAEIRSDPKSHPFRVTLVNGELLPYQLDGIAFAVGAGRAILADDMGLGKTIQGIGVAELLAQIAEIKKVLIVCPASVKSQWSNEIKRFSKNRSVQIVLGAADERFEQYDSKTFFSVCNYEQVMRDLASIERTNWDLIILDEGQRIKNWESKTSRAIKALRSKYALVLTGTPLENRLDDLYSIVQFIDDRHLLPAYRFFQRHRIVEDSGRVVGYKNLDELREKLKPILLRRTKDSVQLDLPERTTEIVSIVPTAEQKAMNDGQMAIVASILGKKFISEMDLLRLQRALLAARMCADSTTLVDKQPQGFSSKLERLRELLEELLAEKDRKIVLFSEWTTMLDLIEPILEELGAEFVRLDGSVPQKKRQQIIQNFQSSPNCRLFIATNAGSIGLNLQNANTVVNVDLPWNPAILEQRIGRAYRMGQKRNVQVYLLVTEATIEENMLATLASKHDLALAALDVGSDVSEILVKSGVEELKRKLEILLGAKPAAKMDALETRASAKKERIAKAGNDLLSAVFQFVGEFADKTDEKIEKPAVSEIGNRIVSKLSESLETDESGKTKFTFTLPEKPVLEGLFQSTLQFLSKVLRN